MLRSLRFLCFSAALITIPGYAMTVEQAQKVVQPFYDFLSNPGDAAAAESAKAILHADWQSYYSNSGFKDVAATVKGISGVGQRVPDLNWEIKEIKVAGDTVIVRGEGSGTPNGDFIGVPHSGKSFRIMSIDMHTISEGKIVKSYHIEDWAGAMRQLRTSE